MLFVVGSVWVACCYGFGVSGLVFVVFVISCFAWYVVCDLICELLVLLWFAACLRLFSCLCVLLLGYCVCDLFVCCLVVTAFCLLCDLVILLFMFGLLCVIAHFCVFGCLLWWFCGC